jgi:hypothetical protein
MKGNNDKTRQQDDVITIVKAMDGRMCYGVAVPLPKKCIGPVQDSVVAKRREIALPVF